MVWMQLLKYLSTKCMESLTVVWMQVIKACSDLPRIIALLVKRKSIFSVLIIKYVKGFLKLLGFFEHEMLSH